MKVIKPENLKHIVGGGERQRLIYIDQLLAAVPPEGGPGTGDVIQAALFTQEHPK